MLTFPVQAAKKLSGGQETRRQQFCAYVFTNSIDDTAKPKAHLAFQEDARYGTFTQGTNTYDGKNLGVKEGGGRLLEGSRIFGNLRYIHPTSRVYKGVFNF